MFCAQRLIQSCGCAGGQSGHGKLLVPRASIMTMVELIPIDMEATATPCSTKAKVKTAAKLRQRPKRRNMRGSILFIS